MSHPIDSELNNFVDKYREEILRVFDVYWRSFSWYLSRDDVLGEACIRLRSKYVNEERDFSNVNLEILFWKKTIRFICSEIYRKRNAGIRLCQNIKNEQTVLTEGLKEDQRENPDPWQCERNAFCLAFQFLSAAKAEALREQYGFNELYTNKNWNEFLNEEPISNDELAKKLKNTVNTVAVKISSGKGNLRSIIASLCRCRSEITSDAWYVYASYRAQGKKINEISIELGRPLEEVIELYNNTTIYINKKVIVRDNSNAILRDIKEFDLSILLPGRPSRKQGIS